MREQELTFLSGLHLLLAFAAFSRRSLAQTRGDDTSCLMGFKHSLQGGLDSWTGIPLATPCISPTVSNFSGITCNNKRVFSIVLNASSLTGTISPSLANCSFLQTLDLSSNQLSGSIPANIGNFTYLTSVNVSNNQLEGSVPVELSNCAYLNIIDLHQNQLTGSIPGQIGLLQRLKVFDVSNNKLSGVIPSTLSNTSSGAPRFNASSFRGNRDLYGYPLPPATSHGLSVPAIVGIGLASGLVSLIVSFTAVCVWLRVTEQGFAAQEGKVSQLISES